MLKIPDITTEQLFELETIKRDCKQLSREQLEILLVEVTRLLMVKENILRELIKDKINQISRS